MTEQTEREQFEAQASLQRGREILTRMGQQPIAQENAVRVCPWNDRECGDREIGWCHACPKRRVAQQAEAVPMDDLIKLNQYIATLRNRFAIYTKKGGAKSRNHNQIFLQIADYLEAQKDGVALYTRPSPQIPECWQPIKTAPKDE